MKSYLFVMSHPPHIGTHVQESLDAILTVAAFDQAVSLLFIGDGVLQLHVAQQPESLGLKDTLAMFRALDLYGVNTLYVEDEALRERGLTVDRLALPVTVVPRAAIGRLLIRYQCIVSG